MWHRKPARYWRPDWSDVPLLSIERSGPEHHWGPERGSGIPGGIAAADRRRRSHEPFSVETTA